MKLLIDTSILIEAERDSFDLAGLENDAEEVFICDAGVTEFLQGQPVKDEGKRQRWRAFLEAVIEPMPSLPLDRAACEMAGSLMYQARRRSHTSNLGDGLHAGVAKLHDLTVVTLDEDHFKALGIATYNPMASRRTPHQAASLMTPHASCGETRTRLHARRSRFAAWRSAI